MTIQIPKQLQNPSLRFVLLQSREKKPFELDWQSINNYSYSSQKLQEHISNGGNYGIVCGYGGLVVIDADHSDVKLIIERNLPQTFTVQTGRGGVHFYYFCRELDKPIRLRDPDGGTVGHLGDIQFTGKQVVGPGSTHPNGKSYEVITDESIQRITPSQIRYALRDYIKMDTETLKNEEKESALQHKTDFDSLRLTDIVNTAGLKQRGDELQGSHPIHGSTTGLNFHINTNKNTWFCFPEETKIYTPEGIKNIEDLKVGDIVYGKNGQNNKVKATFRRDFEGNLYSIHSSFIPNIKMTEGHPILIARCKTCTKNYESYVACKPNCPRRKKDGKHNCPHYKSYDIQWLNVEDINSKTDFLIVPRNHYSISEINIRQHNKSINKQNMNVKVPENIPLNRESGEIFGWYLAEGHITHKYKTGYPYVQLTLGINEEKNAKRIQYLIKKWFGVFPNICKYPKRGTILISCSSMILARWFKYEFCSGSSKKRLGRFINARKDCINGILKGYIEGDGHISKYGSTRTTSASETLSKEVHFTLLREGKFARYFVQQQQNNPKAKSSRHIVEFGSEKKLIGWKNNDFIFLPIKRIIKEKRNVKVFNIETEDNTYLAPFVVHNCFRHSSGGGPLSWIAIQEKLIDCGDALPGILRGNRFGKVLEIAKQKYNLKIILPATIRKVTQKKIDISIAEATNEIMEKNIFKTTTDNEELYYYNDGIYTDNGEIIVKSEAEKRYPEITTYHIKEIIFHIKAKTYTSREKFDNDPKLIHLNNGTFNMTTMTLEPFVPEIISTMRIPIEYKSDSDCPRIKKFLSEVLNPIDIPAIQELFGYCLLKQHPIQKAFMFIGDGANGKSTLLLLFRRFLGRTNVVSVALQSLDRNRFATSVLHGKLANIYADLPDKSLYQTGKFKMLTGGDPVPAEKKFKGSFSFTNYAKLLFSTNKPPESRDETNALYRRLVPINFPNIFEGEKADKYILAKLTTQEELSGLFNWAIEGLKRLLEKGEFSNTLTTDEIRDRYERMVNSILAFIKDYVIISSEDYVIKDELYSEYVKYCNKHNLPPSAKNTVGQELPRYVAVIKTEKKKIPPKGPRKNVWVGIKLAVSEKTKIDSFDERPIQTNKFEKYATDYIRNHKNIPRAFFIKDMLKRYPDLDMENLRSFYDEHKPQKEDTL